MTYLPAWRSTTASYSGGFRQGREDTGPNETVWLRSAVSGALPPLLISSPFIGRYGIVPILCSIKYLEQRQSIGASGMLLANPSKGETLACRELGTRCCGALVSGNTERCLFVHEWSPH